MKRKILLTLIAICCLLQPLALASQNGEQTTPESPVTQIGDRTEPDYLTLTATSDNTVIGLQVIGSPNLSTLQYSYDGENWTNITETITFNTLSNGQYIKFRSDNQVSNSSNHIRFTNSSGTYSASGNINTLIKYSDVSNATIGSYAFYYLFYNCSRLTDISGLSMPATTLSDYCYFGMFSRCTSLVSAAGLSATVLAANCCESMFEYCTSLTTAPKLPATTLADNCYWSMFADCTSLVNAPSLPATNLAENCYTFMFSRCTSLVNAPALPASTMSPFCYYHMFGGCTSLVTPPELPATTLAIDCYKDMFNGCTSLVSAPNLPATTLAKDCYSAMFYGCTSLVSAPNLPATNLANYCYYFMFYACTALVNAPTELPATTLFAYCYGAMFASCTSLVKAPALPSSVLIDNCYLWMFCGCTSLNTVTTYATTWDVTCCPEWLSGVSATGDFYNLGGADIPIGTSGIPTGWTEHKPYTFTGSGSWDEPSNWKAPDGTTPATMPDLTNESVLISGTGDALLNNNVIVKTLTIYDSKALEINSGASLTVSGTISNSNANRLIINDGGQIFQTNTYVRATFKKNIVNPEVWGGSLTGWQFIASPMTNAPISGFEPSSGDYDLFAWDISKGDNPWVNRKAHLNDANYPYFYSYFIRGRGYLASYETQDIASFVGYLNSASTFDFIEKGLVAYSTVHWGNLYLVGNPFTFDVNWSDFDRTNVYDGYAVMNANGSIGYADNSTPIKVGQGFMVITTDGSLTFKYPKTSKDDEADYKSINIIASNSGGSCNAILHFDGSENGGFPIVDNINDEVATIYTVGSGNKYGIRSCDSDVNEIPLCFEAKEIGYNTITMKLNGDLDYVHLIDLQTGCDTDMLNGNEYKFIAATDDDANRFIVKLSSDNETNSNNNFAYQSGNQLFINGEGFVQVFDVLGRTVISENLNGNSIDISRLENASYIVRLVNQNEVKTQKIVVL